MLKRLLDRGNSLLDVCPPVTVVVESGTTGVKVVALYR